MQNLQLINLYKPWTRTEDCGRIWRQVDESTKK